MSTADVYDISKAYLSPEDIAAGWRLERYNGFRLTGPNPFDLETTMTTPVRASASDALQDKWDVPEPLQPDLFSEVIDETISSEEAE